jgi:glycosyltransferase involved in cell wall biosynthesis
LDDNQPDIVVCTDKDANELNALSRVRRSERIMIEAHTGMIDHWIQVRRTTNVLRRFIAKFDMHRLQRAVSRFDVLIALTEDDAKCWNPYVKTTVIPNFYSCQPKRNTALMTEKKRVISVGRLNYQKGQDLLLQAWVIVEARHPDWHLDIYGDGEEKESLNVQRLALNLKNVVIHPSTTEIYDEYIQSDFLVCSSRWESFGLIIIEAMSSGIPVVSFDCDNGPRNIITDAEDGLLAKNGSIEDLAAKMIQMIEQPSRRQQMGTKALRNVERFKEDVVFKEYLELYRQYV